VHDNSPISPRATAFKVAIRAGELDSHDHQAARAAGAVGADRWEACMRARGVSGAMPGWAQVALAAMLASAASAVAAPSPDSVPAAQAQAVRLFFDCGDCGSEYTDFVREQLAFVNHVRDRNEADVHALVTSQFTGGGGIEVTVTLIGRGRFAGVDDTLRFATRAEATDAEIRRVLVQYLGLGLMRYVAHTPLAERIALSDAGRAAAAAAPVKDRWNNWVYSASVNGYFNGQSTTRYISSWGSLSASRVTLQSKFSLSVSASYNESRFELSGGQQLLSVSRSRSAGTSYLWGLGDHWSAKVSASAYASTYDNVDLNASAGPAIEYNLFPYSESTRRQLRFDYGVNYHYADYQEETIYFETSQSLVREGLEIILDSKEPWGSSQVSLKGQNYLHDFGKNRLVASGSISLRLLEGLSLKLSGNAQRVRDQLSLPAGGATDEEILLQRKQLATEYQYYVNVGLTYTFGSIYNNVVNARFGS
jgi:hypothetical protein